MTAMILSLAKEASSMVRGLRWCVMAKKDVPACVMDSSEILQEFIIITTVGFTKRRYGLYNE